MQLASRKGVTLPQGAQGTAMTGDPRSTGQTSNAQPTSQSGDRSGGQMAAQSKGKDQAAANRLAGLSGAGFDREYMRQQLKDHEKAIDLFQKEADKGKDQELKDWANKTLPTLREHQRMAREIASAVGVTDKSSGNSSKSGKSTTSSSRP